MKSACCDVWGGFSHDAVPPLFNNVENLRDSNGWVKGIASSSDGRRRVERFLGEQEISEGFEGWKEQR